MRTSLIAFFLAGCQTQLFSVTLDDATDTVVPAGTEPDQPIDDAQVQDLLGFYLDPAQIEQRGISADHDGERPFLGPRHATVYWSIEKADAVCGESFGDSPRCRGVRHRPSSPAA